MPRARLRVPVYDPPVLELLYALAPGFTGQGLATEMAAAVLDLAFEERGLALVRASTGAPNLASIRVLERLGMTPAGESPGPRWPQLHFQLSRERWRALRDPPLPPGGPMPAP
ncbi:GNAT family N-acetyltransferase [Sorangium sp. So ce233]|uniref:GNAT family N-acetyltransferase n=1 Tax=Sorangium sp. So ce233 TaxID=3133290 RepID=UPI003F62A704